MGRVASRRRFLRACRLRGLGRRPGLDCPSASAPHCYQADPRHDANQNGQRQPASVGPPGHGQAAQLTPADVPGGERVPHARIEEELRGACGDPADDGGDDGGPLLAVTAVPDAKKGERIVVLHRPLPRPIEEITKALSAAGLPNLWIPAADSLFEVDEIPVLGTGKLDLQALREMATDRVAGGSAASR